MSLDVYLYGKPETVECECANCGNKHTRVDEPLLFEWNITHNLGNMAEAARIYEALWRPEDLGAKSAGDLIQPLTKGLYELAHFPETYSRYNPENGWGDYNGLVEFVKKYLQACIDNPDATISVSR